MFEVWGVCFPLVGFLSLPLRRLLEQRVNVRRYPSCRLIILLMAPSSCIGASRRGAAVCRGCAVMGCPQGCAPSPASGHCCAHRAPSSGHRCLPGDAVLPLSFHPGASGVLKNSKGFMYFRLISINKFFSVMRKFSQLG